MLDRLKLSDAVVEQVFWFLLFLGWVPQIATYSTVLDPNVIRDVDFATVIDSRLTEQTYVLHPAVGPLLLAGLLSLGCALRLGRPAWIGGSAFLLWSTTIYYFNPTGTQSLAEGLVHTIYGVLAFYSVYLFLRHGHLLSTAFLIFALLLFLDVPIAWVGTYIIGMANPPTIYGQLFATYEASLTNAVLFLAIAVLVRMIWLIVRDNRDFIAGLSRPVFRSSLGASMRLWYPMALIFLGLMLGWYILLNHVIEPRLVAEIHRITPVLADPGDTPRAPRPAHERTIGKFYTASMVVAGAELHTLINALPDEALASDDAAEGVAKHLTDGFPVRNLPQMVQRSCNSVDIACVLANQFKQFHNQAIQLARTEAIAAAAAAAVEGTAAERRTRMLQAIDKRLAAAPPKPAVSGAPKDLFEQVLNAPGLVDEIPEPRPADAVAETDDGPTTELEPALRAYNLATMESVRRELTASIDAMETTVDETRDAPRQVRDHLNKSYPESELPLMETKWCFFLDIPCVAANGVKRSVNGAMKDARTNTINGIEHKLEEAQAGATQSTETAATRARAEIGGVVDATAGTIDTGMASAFQTYRNLSLLATIYSLIILVKTVMIVFSRVIFAPNGPGSVTAQFQPDAPGRGFGAIKRHKQRLRINKTNSKTYYVARTGVTLEGPPPARRRPLGLRFPISRILAGKWYMNRITGNRRGPDEFSADIKVDEPNELVSWELKAGERVIFSFRDFVGMTDTVSVGRIASLSVTTLILGRMIYHYAEGPGVLILRTTAAARTSPTKDADRPAPMSKLVAWGTSTHFNIVAALTTTDTFLSGYNLRKRSADNVVWDTSTRRGDGPGAGIMRFVKSFLLPI